MGLKVVKCSDEAYAHICNVASKNKTYLADAVDLIVFGKVNTDGNRIGTKSRKAKGTKRAGKEAPEPITTVRKLVEGTTDLFED